MIKIDYQALREAAQNAKDLGGIKNYKRGEQAVAEFESLITPYIVLALLDEREAKDKAWSAQDNHINQQAERIESLEKKNGELGRELESAEKRIAELKKQCAEWERKALSNFEECAAMAERIEELEQATTGQDANVNSQQERVAQSANRHVYHYNAVSNVSGITMSGIAQSPFRIKSQSDLEEFKSALSKVCGFHATAVTSLSYLGREEEE
ncbi:ead/Ea22-like family protein [Escherichia coli]|nr:ead/Ea22-like family protein [Escherichia coli]EKY0832063.1 ead/Ea22-like family protein [Escherichia coli]